MEKLSITQGEFTPKVEFDPASNHFEISGESRPENANHFYSPIIEWLEGYKGEASGKTINFEFRFDYFNSTSAKFIMDIIKELDSINANGNEISIKWHYFEMDEDMKESGEEFSKLVTIPLELVEYK